MSEAKTKFDPPELKGAACLVVRVEGNEFYEKIFPDNEKGNCSNCGRECWVRPYNAHRALICANCLEGATS